MNNMPILEYKCTSCGFKHEAIRSWSDNVFCPECELKMIRVPSVTAKRRDMTVVENEKAKK